MTPRRRRSSEETALLRRRAVFLGVAVLALTATGTALFGDRGYLEVRRYQAQKSALIQEIQLLEEDVRNLRREIIDLRKNAQAMERLAREELMLARPGEILFLYPREELATRTTSPDEGDDVTQASPEEI